MLFCALIPSPDYRGIAYTRSYLDMGLVAMRRAGDTTVTSAADLSGRTVAIIADPAARSALDECGIVPGDLRQVYDDDYYDPVADGVYDGFIIDLPIVHWCATDPASPRRGCLIHRLASAPICRGSWIVRAGHQSFKRVKDPVWIHADVMGQLLIPLRRAENGQGSSNRQRIDGHTLV